MNDSSETRVLPALGQILQQQAPGIRIESYYTRRRDVPRDLASGGLDLAIDAPLINDPQLCHGPLMSERYVCMLRKDHPLASKTLKLEHYLALGHIHVSSRRKGLGHVDSVLAKLGVSRKIQMRVQHYLVAPTIVQRSNLALTAPVRLAQLCDAKILELPFEVPPLAWHLYWHRSADLDQANTWLREILQRLMSAEMNGDECKLPSA